MSCPSAHSCNTSQLDSHSSTASSRLTSCPPHEVDDGSAEVAAWLGEQGGGLGALSALFQEHGLDSLGIVILFSVSE